MPLHRYSADEWLARPADRDDAGGTPDQREAVRSICRRVAAEGEAALREFALRFDGWAPAEGESWALGRPDMDLALASLPVEQRSALELAARRIRAFHEAETF
jgi:histidinol dehydrogenase